MDKGALKVAKKILSLNCGPYAFGGIYPDWKKRKVVFGWVAETEFENIALVMVVVWNLPPKWPPFKSSSCFTEPPSTAFIP
ncbi:unnamed protein product [marine sediment metagenome]|uniref:Uncharacterized protein n=1 Tax=marine sediment metagenome TaxID=412755 RepID=X1U0Z5_9ZZZZ